MTTDEKTDRKQDPEEEELPEGTIINAPHDARRWVQIGEGPGTFHLIDQEKTAGNARPVITMCGQETQSILFLDRLPSGSDSDPGLVNEDCYEFVGIPAPKGRKADEEEYEADGEKAARLAVEERDAAAEEPRTAEVENVSTEGKKGNAKTK